MKEYKIFSLKKYSILTLTAILCGYIGHAQDKKAVIQGTTDHTEPMVVRFIAFDKATQSKKVDSAQVVNGKFSIQVSFKGLASSVMITATYNGKSISQGSSDIKSLLVDENGAKIYIKDKVRDAIISDSPLETERDRFVNATYIPEADSAGMHFYINGTSPIVTQIMFGDNSNSEENKKLKAFLEKQERFLTQKLALQRKFIGQNPDSYFAILAIEDQIRYGKDLPSIPAMIKSLSPRLQNSGEMKLTWALLEKTKSAPNTHESIEKMEQKMKDSHKTLTIGSTAPDFTLKDEKNKSVSLSDFKGKYVLLDFWASWCVPCRKENPNLIKAYNEFKNRNFTVVGIALEEKRSEQAWFNAIKKDGLPWTQLVDFEDAVAGKLYNVHSIPSNYLIDPSGKIIGVNLHSEELQQKLTEILSDL